jgi:uncharacterized protein (DUF2252 family)
MNPSPNSFLVELERVEKASALRAWLKRDKLARSAFNYFRGTAKEFYLYWARQDVLKSPLVWSCGDVHVKNVGTYRAANGIPYFDQDDFDDGCLSPISFDLGRAAVGLTLTQGANTAVEFLATYAQTLAEGKPYHVEPECAVGPTKLLLDRIESRSQKSFLEKWVSKDRIQDIVGETYRLPAAARKRAQILFEGWAKLQPNPKYYRVLDVCGSTAGIGSLTHERYLILVQGKNRPHILDMKEATPSTLAAANRTKQPAWRNEAQRVATIQRFMQYMPIAHLGWTETFPVSFVLTEFQPAEDRMDSLELSKKAYAKFAQQWAQLVAWGHLRAAGWKGSPPTDAVIDFGKRLNLKAQNRILKLATATARQIAQAHRHYAETVLPE